MSATPPPALDASSDEWLAEIHREVFEQLIGCWEDVVAGKGSQFIQVSVDSDWGERRVLRTLLNELIERQPAGERFHGPPPRGSLRPTVEDGSAMPSFFSFAVRCAAGSEVTQPDLVEMQQQLTAWQFDLRAVPENRSQRAQAGNQVGFDQVQATAEILAPFASSSTTGPALLAVSVGRVGYQSARAFQRRYNVYDLDTKRTDLCARSLGHLSRNVPILVVVEDAQLMSPEFLGLIIEMLQQVGARVLTVAVRPRSQIPTWSSAVPEQVTSRRIDPPPVDGFARRHEAQHSLGTNADHVIVEAVVAHSTTLGALGRMFDAPSISRALRRRQLTESDITSWRDPKRDLSELSEDRGRTLSAAALIGSLVPATWVELLGESVDDALVSLEADGWFDRVTPDLMRFKSEPSRLVARDAAMQFLTAEERATIEQGAPDALRLAMSERKSASPASIWHLAARAVAAPDPPVVQIKQAAELAAEAGAFRTAASLADALGEGAWSVAERCAVARWRYVSGSRDPVTDPVSTVVNGLLELSVRPVGWEDHANSVVESLGELEMSEVSERLAWWWFELACRFADHGNVERTQDAVSRATAISDDTDLQLSADSLIEELDTEFGMKQRLLDDLEGQLASDLKAGVSPHLLVSLRGEVCFLAYELGHWRQACDHATIFAADRERVLGADHPDTLSAQAWLALSYWADGRIKDAMAIEERVLSDRERILGADHPDTLKTRADLAASYWADGRFKDAIAIQERLLPDIERVLGADHRVTLSVRGNIAAAYRSDGRLNDAIVIQERLLPDIESVLGADHQQTLGVRANLALSYWADGRIKDAIAIQEQVLTDRERVLGSDHPDTLSTRSNLATSYQADGRTKEAIAIQEQVLSGYGRLLGIDHPDTLCARSKLANLVESLSMSTVSLLDRANEQRSPIPSNRLTEPLQTIRQLTRTLGPRWLRQAWRAFRRT